MAKKKFVVGCFDDEAVLFPAVKKVRTAGYKIHDVYTPFAVHGLDHAMGLRETSLHTAGFIYGITGTTTAISAISWIFTKDWPLNIGGKPHFALEVEPEEYEKTKACFLERKIKITDTVVWRSGQESFYFEDPEGNVGEVVPVGIWE